MVETRSDRPRERRRGVRHRLTRPLAARVRAINEALIRDLSTGGALIELGRSLAPGSRCEVNLELEGVKAKATARVARCHLLHGGARYEAGLEFESIDETTVAAIEKILTGTSPGEPLPGTIRTN
jgi:hypothetical protein